MTYPLPNVRTELCLGKCVTKAFQLWFLVASFSMHELVVPQKLTPASVCAKHRRMVKVSIDYQGSLRCSVRHELSGASFCTDAPVDNNEKGEGFSPTDLCASALGSCIGTIVGMQMQRLGHDMTGMRIEVTKEISKYPPRRISRLATEIWLPVELS